MFTGDNIYITDIIYDSHTESKDMCSISVCSEALNENVTIK